MTTPRAWRKSSYSNGTGLDCVEFARVGGKVAVRDSKNATGSVLTSNAVAFETFLTVTCLEEHHA